MKQDIEQAVVSAVQELFGVELEAELARPDEQFGDYTTNVALRLSKQVGKNPREIADALAATLLERLGANAAEVAVAGPGFLNIRLSDARFSRELNTILADKETYGASTRYKDKVVIAEYSDPNPFKVLHAGHLYTSVVGDAIANLFAVAGAHVHRVNFGGDVGLHVGKTMWAIVNRLGGENPNGLADIPEAERSEWLAAAYIEGTNAYEDSEQAKTEIVTLNKRVYQLHAENDTSSPFARIYWTCRQWSYEYFDAFYARIGTHFEKYYPESETAPLGLQTVREHIGPVYKESDGAVIFDGDAHGLHTRVFINSEGLPTYEAKDVGLIMKKWADYQFDLSVVITGNDIIEYMKVVLKSIEQFQPELPARTRHLTHGIVKLEGGTKMSSRKGNILRAVDVLEAAAAANKAATGNEDEQVTLGAVKYAFLRPRMGGDVIYDPKESVSLQGNSGPYLQYAHARAVNILRKATNQPGTSYDGELNESERNLVRKLTEYPETIDKALDDMLPHHICTYLYELAQVFNRFYEQNRVIGDERETDRLTLVSAYVGVLRNGLKLLGVHAPDTM
jgi:arginyl-tRNA synthetase